MTAFDAGSLGCSGHLTWRIKKSGGRHVTGAEPVEVGEILRVDVREDRRRRGIAGALYEQALAVAAAQGWPYMIDHSARRTAEGNGWARKIQKRFGCHVPDLESGRFHVPGAAFRDALRPTSSAL